MNARLEVDEAVDPAFVEPIPVWPSGGGEEHAQNGANGSLLCKTRPLS